MLCVMNGWALLVAYSKAGVYEIAGSNPNREGIRLANDRKKMRSYSPGLLIKSSVLLGLFYSRLRQIEQNMVGFGKDFMSVCKRQLMV